jgi:hypothetical protein
MKLSPSSLDDVTYVASIIIFFNEAGYETHATGCLPKRRIFFHFLQTVIQYCDRAEMNLLFWNDVCNILSKKCEFVQLAFM